LNHKSSSFLIWWLKNRTGLHLQRFTQDEKTIHSINTEAVPQAGIGGNEEHELGRSASEQLVMQLAPKAGKIDTRRTPGEHSGKIQNR
jgi:hypothetical protein